MAVFISYSSRDKALLDPLTKRLREANLDWWLDQQLGGGQLWWREVLQQIRDCEVFIAALSKSFVDTRACRAELKYAQALGKPIVPVQIGPLDSIEENPLPGIHAVDFLHPSVDAGSELNASVYAQREKSRPLPDPLPPEPPMPSAYLTQEMKMASPGIPGFSLRTPLPPTQVVPPMSAEPLPPGPPGFGMGAPVPQGLSERPGTPPPPRPPGPPGFGMGAFAPPQYAPPVGRRRGNRTWLVAAAIAAAVVVVVVVVLMMVL
jgi:hypothetical protein